MSRSLQRNQASPAAKSAPGRPRSAPGSRRPSAIRRLEEKQRDAKSAKEIAANVRQATEDPQSPDAALWRLTSWAERFCGKPGTAVLHVWQGRRAIERVFNAKRQSRDLRTSNGMTSRALGRKLTQSWLAARTKHSQGMALSMANLEGSEAQEIAGLLMYLEMAVALIPDLSATRLITIWQLPEPSWAEEHRTAAAATRLQSGNKNPLRLLEPQLMPDARLPEFAKPASESKVEQPSPETQKEEEQPEEPEEVKEQSQTWDIKQSFKFCKLGEEDLFRGKMRVLQPDITTVRAAVEHLNTTCAVDECCMALNTANGYFYALYQQGERQTALAMLGIPEPCGFLSANVFAAYNLKTPEVDGVQPGLPVPYAVCRVGDEEYRTTGVNQTTNPSWRATDFEFHVNLRDENHKILYVEVFDRRLGLDNASLGSASLDLSTIEPKQPLRKVLGLQGGGVGQVVLNLEFIPKREYRDRTVPRSLRPAQRRFRKEKPGWTIFEQEMVYEEEITSFLSSLKPSSKSPKPSAQDTLQRARTPHGYQAKLAAKVEEGLSVAARFDDPAALPPDWEPGWDAESRSFHFFNRRLQKTVLTRNAVDRVEADIAREIGGLPEGWEAAWDNGSNSYYFYNRQLQKTVWTREDVMDVEVEAILAGPSPRASPSQGIGYRAEVVEAVPQDFEEMAPLSVPGGIVKAGTVLRCIEPVSTVFESPTSDLEFQHVTKGALVTAAGPLVNVDGYLMVPIQPVGAIQFNMFEVADGAESQSPADGNPPASSPRNPPSSSPRNPPPPSSPPIQDAGAAQGESFGSAKTEPVGKSEDSWTTKKKSKRRRFLTRIGVFEKMGRPQAATEDEEDDLGKSRATTEDEEDQSVTPVVTITDLSTDSPASGGLLIPDPPQSRTSSLDFSQPPPRSRPLRVSPRVKVQDPDSD